MHNTTQHIPYISIIAAVGRARELGARGTLLWRIPEDLRYFHDTTVGHPVIMGLTTYRSLPPQARPLPKRTNIVLMTPAELADFDAPAGVVAAHSLDDALDYARDVARETGVDEVFVIGGASVYAQALPLADRLYITEVDADFPEADVFFPAYADLFVRKINVRTSCDENYRYTFNILEKDI